MLVIENSYLKRITSKAFKLIELLPMDIRLLFFCVVLEYFFMVLGNGKIVYSIIL